MCLMTVGLYEENKYFLIFNIQDLIRIKRFIKETNTKVNNVSGNTKDFTTVGFLRM